MHPFASGSVMNPAISCALLMMSGGQTWYHTRYAATRYAAMIVSAPCGLSIDPFLNRTRSAATSCVPCIQRCQSPVSHNMRPLLTVRMHACSAWAILQCLPPPPRAAHVR